MVVVFRADARKRRKPKIEGLRSRTVPTERRCCIMPRRGVGTVIPPLTHVAHLQKNLFSFSQRSLWLSRACLGKSSVLVRIFSAPPPRSQPAQAQAVLLLPLTADSNPRAVQAQSSLVARKRNGPFCQFPLMFVRSLSWQIVVFYQETARKTERRALVCSPLRRGVSASTSCAAVSVHARVASPSMTAWMIGWPPR